MATMDPLNIIKIISAIALVIVAFTSAVIVLKKNSKYWLNRFFALFYISIGLGFLLYTLYHFIFGNQDVTIGIMITAHILLNASFACLLMTMYILELSEQVAMNIKYWGFSFGLFLLSAIGYFIPVFKPSIEDVDAYNAGTLVNTDTPGAWFILVNLYRFVILIYVVIRYFRMMNKATGITKLRLKKFRDSILVSIPGVIFNLLGGTIAPESMEVYLEIIGLIILALALLINLQAFFVKEE